eukprot:764433-Hanusia_phi.AAC.1
MSSSSIIKRDSEVKIHVVQCTMLLQGAQALIQLGLDFLEEFKVQVAAHYHAEQGPAEFDVHQVSVPDCEAQQSSKRMHPALCGAQLRGAIDDHAFLLLLA